MEKIIPKKVLILGSTGMLGHMLFFYLKKNKKFKIYDLSFRKKLNPKSMICDIQNISDLEKKINKIKPDVIINCIGIIIQNIENKLSDSIYINAFFPNKLKEIVRPFKTKIIHISTDCVFDGYKGSYFESDNKTAQDTYGLSKSLGEIKDKDLTLRTSMIGPELKDNGEGLFSWFINQKGEVNGFTESIWGGVTTLVLADIIIKSINENYTGLIHITNGEPISKYDLLNLIKDKFELDKINLKKVSGKKNDKSLKTKFSYFQIPTYEEMILDMKNFIENNNYR